MSTAIELNEHERCVLSNALTDILKGRGVDLNDDATCDYVEGMTHDDFFEDVIEQVNAYMNFVVGRVSVHKEETK